MNSDLHIGESQIPQTPEVPISFKLKDSAVKTNHLDDGAVTPSKLSPDVPSFITSDIDQKYERITQEINARIGRLPGGSNMTVPIEYGDLVVLRDSNKLVPGTWYRITDYTATTVQEETQSAGHVFDVIVFATDTNRLSENAFAAHHEGDTYFSDSSLEAWELKYCLDNDTDRFTWADTVNGKGVIWFMRDEYNNECPYDFKNIQFARYKITDCPKSPGIVHNYAVNNKLITGITVDTTAIYCYTFCMINVNEEIVDDVSTLQRKYPYDGKKFRRVHSNIIKPYIVRGETTVIIEGTETTIYPDMMALPNNVFVTDTNRLDFEGYYSNTLEANCHHNTLGNDSCDNVFGMECSYNTSVSECRDNTLGFLCTSNIFGSGFDVNTLGKECSGNAFGYDCKYITVMSRCSANTFGDECRYIILEGLCGGNSFGNGCLRVTLNQGCNSNFIAQDSSEVTLGVGCHNIKFTKPSGTLNAYYKNIIVENGNQYIYLDCDATTSGARPCQNVLIGIGVNNSTSYKTLTVAPGNEFKTTFKTVNDVDINV